MNIASHGWHGSAWEMLVRLSDADGSATHPHVLRLADPRSSHRDLADAVHALCAVHGRHPGLIDAALFHGAQPDAYAWLDGVAAGFAEERALLAQIAAAAGPLPSTPGQAETEAALVGVRHAIEMLAGSDRTGCATGAAAMLAIDWLTIRSVLARAADRFSVALPVTALPSQAETATAIVDLGASAAIERAMNFGGRQLLAQHRGLWDLLEARSSARG